MEREDKWLFVVALLLAALLLVGPALDGTQLGLLLDVLVRVLVAAPVAALNGSFFSW